MGTRKAALTAVVLVGILTSSVLTTRRPVSASSVLLVPENVSSIQQAISQVPHLGVIDIAPVPILSRHPAY